MSQQVVDTATLACTFGTAPGQFQVLGDPGVKAGGNLAATTQDIESINMTGFFGACDSLSNPLYQSTQTTPNTCNPAIGGPWAPVVSKVKIKNINALDSSGSTCTCTYAGGTISVQSAGCEKVMLP